MEPVNVMVIGVGPHARRIYIPILKQLSQTMPVRLVAIVDLVSQAKSINQYLSEIDYSLETIYFDHFDGSAGLPDNCKTILDNLIKKFNIQGVIISTEAMAHKMYAEWALRRNLHILMDKPISMRKSVSTELDQAIALLDDYYDLLDLYKKQQRVKPTAFTINAQRRYEYGFEKVKELISEVRDRFNVPVTSIQAMHADGTWMFPMEILTQKSHSHFDGYGKVAHSGFHIFDMVWQLYKAGLVDQKKPDALEIISSPLLPSGLSINLSEYDYQNYFNTEYESTGLTENSYGIKVQNYGEIDSFNIVRLLKGDKNICNISINLLHSSFSRRAWATPNEDRYKGNGRIKHQQFIIQQGPFQSIQIHNYQSKSSHDTDNSNEFDVGGNNHFDIYIFRNSGMFKSNQPFTKISAKELEDNKHSGRLINESAKERVIIEFINFMLGKINKNDLKSNIDTYAIPTKIMSGIYQSSALLAKRQNPLINISL